MTPRCPHDPLLAATMSTDAPLNQLTPPKIEGKGCEDDPINQHQLCCEVADAEQPGQGAGPLWGSDR